MLYLPDISRVAIGRKGLIYPYENRESFSGAQLPAACALRLGDYSGQDKVCTATIIIFSILVY